MPGHLEFLNLGACAWGLGPYLYERDLAHSLVHYPILNPSILTPRSFHHLPTLTQLKREKADIPIQIHL